jgi:hypothetical protein
MRKAALLTAAAMATTFGLVATGPASVQAAEPTVDLGVAATFGALTSAAFDATGASSTFRGDTGSSSYTFVGDGHIGTPFVGAGSYVDATNAVIAAFDDAAARDAAGNILDALLDGKVFGPGVHKSGAAVTSTAGTPTASTKFTIDGQGDPDAVFIFQVNGALGLGANTEMLLINGAQAKNVFWQLVGGLGIGAGNTFVGTSLANGAVSVGIGSIVNGRLLTKSGAITFATSDLYSAPPSVSINNGSAFTSNVSSPAISGVTSVVSPDAVTVTIDGVIQADQPVPAANGAWSLTLDGELNNTTHEVIATVSDGAGNTGTFTQFLTVNAPVPTISIDGGTTFTTDDQTPTISGTTDRPAGQSVELTLTRTKPALVLNRTALVQTNGTWNITPNGLTGGEWTIVAGVADSAGNVTTATQVLNIEMIFAITSSALTNDTTPVITGTVESGSVISVTVDTLVFTVTQDDTIWSATTNSTFGQGEFPVVVTATAGSVSTVIEQELTIDLDGPAISINGGANLTTNDTTPTISGQAPDVAAGTVVNVSIDGAQPLTAVVQSDQSWRVTPSADLDPGNRAVVATVADPAGNTGTATQTLFVDAAPFVKVAPVDLGVASTFGAVTPAAFDATGASTFRGDTGSSTYTFVGDGHMGTPFFGAGTYVDATNAVTAAYSDAAARVAGVTALPALLDGKTVGPGVHKSAAAVTSTAGTPTASTIFTIDGQGHPDAVFIFQVVGALGLGAHTEMVLINGAQAKNVFWQITAGLGIGAGTTFVGTSLANAAVTVGIGSLVNGRLLTKAGAIAFAASDLFSGAPTVSINNGAAVSSTSSNPVISGTTNVEAPASVAVTINTVLQQDKPVPAGGEWTLTLDNGSLVDGEYAVVATVTDGAGNIGSFTQILTIDTILPVVTIDPGATNATDDVAPTITGTTDVSGQTVSINFSRTSPGLNFNRTAVSQADKTWSFTPSDPNLSVGTWTIVATVVDPATNSTNATQTLTVSENPGGGGGGTTTGGTTDGGTTTGGTTDGGTTTDGGATTGGTTTDGGATTGGTTTGGTTTDGGATTGGTTTGGTTTGGTTTDGGATTGGTTTGGATTGGATTGGGAIGGGAIGGGAIGGSTTGGTTGGTITATPPITGSGAVPGSTVTVTIGNETLTTIADENGDWTVTPLTPMGPGVYVATVTIVAPDGTSETTTRTVTVVAPPAGGTTGGTIDTTPPITGTGAEPGSTVTVAIGDRTLTTTVDGNGNWTVTPLTPLSPGVHVALITITDADGNSVTTSRTITVIASSSSGSNLVGPIRVFDTRPGQSPASLRAVVKKQVSGSYELEVQMTELGTFTPIDGVGAVSMNVVSTGSGASGFLTAYDCGTRELVSSLNFSAGVTVGNAVIAPVSADGTVCFYSSTPTDIVVDLNGWFAVGKAFTAVGPKRVFDTRPGQSPNSSRVVVKKQVSGGYELEVQMTALGAFVPATGVGAVSLNVTSTGSAAAGFITVYSCGARELVASVNFPAGGTVGNAVTAPLSSTGTVCFYSSSPTDIVVDINGWFAAGEGFTPVGPKRVFDTRPGQSPDSLRAVTKKQVSGGYELEVQMTDLGRFTPSAGMSAVSLNVTSTGSRAAGYITVYSCGTRELVASVNFPAGGTVGNAVIAPLSSSGKVCFYSSSPTDIVVEINAWFAA